MLSEEARPVTPQLVFTGAPPRAQEAIDFYTGLLPDSAVEMVAISGTEPGVVSFAQVRLAELGTLPHGLHPRPRVHVHPRDVPGASGGHSSRN